MSHASTGDPSAAPPTSRALFVESTDRPSGRLLTGVLNSLGVRSPVADQTARLAALHRELLQRSQVQPADARPSAWFDAGRIAVQDRPRSEALAWLHTQFTDDVSELVIEDPQGVWFISLWHAACVRVGVDPLYVLALRPFDAMAAEQSSRQSRGGSEAGRAASWLNRVLHAERATRGAPRALVLHTDLLQDWTVPIHDLGERFGLEGVQGASVKQIRRAHDLMGAHTTPPSARPSSDLDVPKALRTLMDETWDQLAAVSRAPEEPAHAHAALDQLRREYARLYEEAEQIAHSTVVAARRAGRRTGSRAASPPDDAATTSQPSSSMARRVRGLLSQGESDPS